MLGALGYISQAALTSPHIYYAMAKDGLFFKSLAWLPEKTRVPVVAILLQGALAIGIGFSGRYDQILTYVMSGEFIFFVLTGISIFIFRARSTGHEYEMPGHPYTTIFFILVGAVVAVMMFFANLINSLIGMGIIAAGIPAYFFFGSGKARKARN